MVKVSVVDSQIIFASKDKVLSPIRWRKEILETYKRLGYLRTVKLEEISETITDGVHVTPTYTKKGYKFLSSQCIDTPFINEKQIKIVSTTWYLKYKKEFVQKDDILIAKSGRIGTVAIVVEDEKYAFYEGVALVRLQKGEIRPYYAVIFLASKFGQHQIESKVKGISQPHLHLEEIREIRVPILPEDFQLHIEQLVKQAYEKRKLAEQRYQQAEELLYQLLGISKEEIEKLEAEKAYETNFKEVKKAFRFDAEYYHPRYLGILDLMKKVPFEVKPLKEVVKISNETIDPTKEPYKTKKFKYVPIAKINESGEIFEWDEFYGWQAPSRARMVIRKGDILIPSLSGTFDKIALVPEELDGQLATTGCFVVRARNDYPEFLFLLFRLERLTTGAIMSAVPKTIFGSLLIPDIPRDEQQKIANLVREYFKLRKEARQLVQRAIREVEEAIENASKTNGE